MNNMNIPLLNSNYTYHVGKHYLMYGNLRSTLEKYENQTLYLTIAISENWKKDPDQTALQIARSWADFSDELIEARYYQVRLGSMQKADNQLVIQGSL